MPEFQLIHWVLIYLIFLGAIIARILVLRKRIRQLEQELAFMREVLELEYPQTNGCRNYYEESLQD